MRRIRAAASVAVVLTATILVALTRPQQAEPRTAVIACGAAGRWAVKTLQDRPHLRPARLVTLRYLVTRRTPSHLPDLPDRRRPFEHHVFTVYAVVDLVQPEDDGDLHVVLDDGHETMIAEAPAAACDSRAAPVLRRAMAVARAHVRICRRAKVTGVAFFDFFHGQTGVAANAIELHPILAFHCVAG